MDCGVKIVKYLVFIFNLVFFITGLLLLIFGSIGLASSKFDAISTALEGQTSIRGLSIGILILGLVVMFIAFLGCCGAYKENNCMLMTFAGILCVIFLAEIIVGIVAFVKRGDIEEYIDNNQDFKRALLNGYYEGDDTDTFKTMWDETQIDYKCCGYDGYSDWGSRIPKSCCGASATETTDCSISSTTKPYSGGCKEEVKDVIKSQANMIGIGGIILAIIQVLAIVFACCLARAVREDKGGTV